MFPNIHIHIAKSLTDRFAALCLLVLLSPALITIAVLVRLKIGRGVLFHQQRPGLGGRPFSMFKFRTMTNARDDAGNFLPDEMRITPLGQFLRRTSLDELPELWNVLRGEMSLVGPRPLLPQYLDLYTPEQARRHEVLPGITGWAQVNGRNAISWEEKFRLDVWYVDHRSLWLDFLILCRTVLKVIWPTDINQAGHVTMPAFDRASSSRVSLIGAGGHAKVVLDTLQASGHYVDRIYDDHPALHGQLFCGIPIVGPLNLLDDCPNQKAFIAIGSCQKRAEIAARYNCQWMTAVHPAAYVAPTATIGPGSLVAAGAVIQADAKVGDHVIVNTGTTIDHDCTLHDFVHLCPGTHLAGNVTVGVGTMCGMGSNILPGVHVGDHAVVGAGSVVNRNVADHSTVVGVPARLVPVGISQAVARPYVA